jgi:hypothetical protein
MHYANGRAAKAGDLVRGKGYNIKHEIIGLLVYANPGASACNCKVATVTTGSQVLNNAKSQHVERTDGSIFLAGEFDPPSLHAVMATLEYGQLDAFVAIDPNTGDVLPAES